MLSCRKKRGACLLISTVENVGSIHAVNCKFSGASCFSTCCMHFRQDQDCEPQQLHLDIPYMHVYFLHTCGLTDKDHTYTCLPHIYVSIYTIICIYAYILQIYTYVHIHTCTYAYIHIHIHIHIYIHIQIHLYTYTCTCTCTCTYTYTYTYTYIYIYILTYIHIFIYMYTYHVHLQ